MPFLSVQNGTINLSILEAAHTLAYTASEAGSK